MKVYFCPFNSAVSQNELIRFAGFALDYQTGKNEERALQASNLTKEHAVYMADHIGRCLNCGHEIERYIGKYYAVISLAEALGLNRGEGPDSMDEFMDNMERKAGRGDPEHWLEAVYRTVNDLAKKTGPSKKP